MNVIPYLTIRGASAAIEFYKKAFGATELFRMAGQDGKRLMHASIQIGDTTIMMSDEFPEFGGDCKSPQTLGGTAVTLHINSPDVDKTVATAVAAGAKITVPVEDQFWGDRYGRVVDPFGHHWSVSTHKKDLSPQEIEAAMKALPSRHDNK